MLSCSQNSSNVSKTKFVPKSETTLLDILYCKNNLAFCYWLICIEPLHQFCDRGFPVVIYNIKIMLVINCEDVGSYRFPWLPCNFM